MTSGDDPKTEELRVQQSSKARDERRSAEESTTGDETATHDRRADKAAYLAARLAEKERSENEDKERE
jgi:phosphopantetheinyl transferase (holo-ACP synthase)